MEKRSTPRPHLVTTAEAADLLEVSTDTVRALATAGYLVPTPDPDGVVDGGGPAFSLGDVKAFVARNADNGSGNLFATEPGSVDVSDLLSALDGRAEEMALRAFDIFAAVFPEATEWDDDTRETFLVQSAGRFEAILAVASQGVEVDEALVDDLEEVGASASRSGSPLPQLLVLLRISRDLVVQTAVEIAEEHGRHWSLALALLLTRILPAMDRLTDSLAQGYWVDMLLREEEQKARYQHVVEHTANGVYEIDLDGTIQYANPALGLILGRPVESLIGARIADAMTPAGGAPELEPLHTGARVSRPMELVVFRPDGVRRVLEVRATAREEEGEIVGFVGVVRDATTARDLEADKNEFLSLITYDLRQPLTTVLGLGATLESHSDELPADRIRRIGSSIRRQAERMTRLADDLYDISRLEARDLLLSPRIANLGEVVEAALATIEGGEVVQIDIDDNAEVFADPRRLEQVIANLAENALAYGAPPVVVSASPRLAGARAEPGTVEISVRDAGPGVADTVVPSLFHRVRLLARRDRDRSRGTGLGLSLVKGLIEAMGGRVWYEGAPGGGAEFRLSVPARARR